MKNLFKGIEIVFSQEAIDNTESNKNFRETWGFNKDLRPQFENREAIVTDLITRYSNYSGVEIEPAYTRRENGQVVVYVSAQKTIRGMLKDELAQKLADGTLTSVNYGVMKADATFHPTTK